MSQSNSGFNIKDNRMFNPDGTLREGFAIAEDKPAAEPARPTPAPQPKAAPAEQPHQPSPFRDAPRQPPAAAKSPTTEARAKAEPGSAYASGEAIDFSTFIISLAQSAQISLGLVPNPLTGMAETDVAHARQTIDIIGMLEEKTQGNLTPEESGFLRHLLYQLRMQFVEISGGRPR